ncbi:hypothetical protein HMPREF9371_0337 [Neisseria shayeganii 871]|uniref:Uncharacterized protein n=1 Tax=Neisseria shayeganii 871 TaxID=1032488 RepID=G4CFE8_9NEIS|nr:hypothetical protein HMPREF9371_0337 [Neisseria shayeganii 871]
MHDVRIYTINRPRINGFMSKRNKILIYVNVFCLFGSDASRFFN